MLVLCRVFPKTQNAWAYPADLTLGHSGPEFDMLGV